MTSGTAKQTIQLSLLGSPTPGDSVALSCGLNSSSDDAIRLFSVELRYNATQ